ncbi:MAG TPA: sirohydrochlorin chelatase [Dehalococcoidia bacterium]|nr:sirohydrochlorin chelatase [Dehalococcoidia bacterium]
MVPCTWPSPPTGRRPGVILLAHGSRRGDDTPRGASALAHELSRRLGGLPVTVAYLEALTPSPPEAARLLLAQGVDLLVVQPLLLGEGQHRQEACAVARELARLWPGLEVLSGRPLARHPLLASLVARRAEALLRGQRQPWGLLLVKAYTRYNGGDLGWAQSLAEAAAEALAGECRAAVAQSGPGPPTLAEAGEELLPHVSTLLVFPCLLFRGKIWEQDVVPAVEDLRRRHPHKGILLSGPLGPDQAVATMLWDRVREVLAGCRR